MTDRIEYDDDGLLDEVVAGDAHLERMSGKSWFLAMQRVDGTSFCVWFKGKVVSVEERDAGKWFLDNAPPPPHLSRNMWAGIAADEKKRADDADADARQAVAAGKALADLADGYINWEDMTEAERRVLADMRSVIGAAAIRAQGGGE